MNNVMKLITENFINKGLAIPTVFLSCLLVSSAAQAEVKEILDDGKDIYIHTQKDHASTIIFPEAITEVVRGFEADSYVIQRNAKDPRVLEVMPTDSELAEITVTGVSNEEYSLRFLKSGEFYSKVTILPLSQAIKPKDMLTEASMPKDAVQNVEVADNKGKEVGPDAKSETINSLVTILPSATAKVPTQPTNDKNTEQSAFNDALPAQLSLKVTLKGNGLPLKVYLSTISQVTGYNIITTPEIDSQKTSLNLENIEVWRALKSLLYKFGYGFKVSQEDLIITETETRIFNITMPAVDQTFTDQTSNESFANNTSSSSGSSSNNQQSQQVDVGAKIFYENKAPKLSLWTDLESNIKSMITDKIGTYSFNKSSGSIIVTDKPQVLDKIGDLVSTINENLSRQQTFEIQIIEVTLNNDYETGIDWNAIAASGIKGLNNISLNTNFTAQGFTSGQLLSLETQGPTTTSGKGSNGVSLFIKALDSMGSVNIVSKPSITVSNMFPCIIQEVTSIPYISGTGTTLGNNVTQSNVTTSQVSDGLTMRLEAKINDEKTVLNISAAVNTLDSMTTVPVGNGLTIQEPQVSTKNITTNVSVEPGKTLILGGLISTTKTISQQGIPYLSKIPFFGNAFQYKGKSGQKTELVIIITPKKVVKNI